MTPATPFIDQGAWQTRTQLPRDPATPGLRGSVCSRAARKAVGPLPVGQSREAPQRSVGPGEARLTARRAATASCLPSEFGRHGQPLSLIQPGCSPSEMWQNHPELRDRPAESESTTQQARALTLACATWSLVSVWSRPGDPPIANVLPTGLNAPGSQNEELGLRCSSATKT